VDVQAQAYPSKPVRMITTQPGGAVDLVARLIAQRLGDSIGQPVIVESRGGGLVAIDLVAKAQPDGYTLLFYGSTVWMAPLLQRVTWDPVKDFAPITLAMSYPNLLVVHPSLPAKSVRELIALARARPGELNFGSGSIGASTHLAAELFKAMTGAPIAGIPYKSGAAAMVALVSGEVQLMFSTVGLVAQYVKTGRLRALAVTSAKPSPLAPGLPTVAAAGVPGYESVSHVGLFAPAQTPATVIQRLNRETVAALRRPELREQIANAAAEAIGSSPEEFAEAIRQETARWTKVIKDTGMRAQ
ncbi:MAG: tripartite tricarboxylate transporter substrate binding protein, partial [Burkholderiales bacterium]